MSTTSELLTPAEAAVVANVSVRDVNRVIDEHIVPARLYSLRNGRYLKADACALVAFYYAAAGSLTSAERTQVIKTLSAEALVSKMRSPTAMRWVYRRDFLTVDLLPLAEATFARHAALRRAREMVVEDPEILGGTPVIRGTRIPVHDVAAAGADDVRVKAAYPGLDEERIELARLYVRANPARGRPRKTAINGLTLISERKVARRRRA